MAKDNPVSQVGDRWDVVFIVKGYDHDQAHALLECVTFDEAVECVREHASDWGCPLAIWPSWAYWPEVGENDLRLIDMMETKFRSLKTDLAAKRKADRKLKVSA